MRSVAFRALEKNDGDTWVLVLIAYLQGASFRLAVSVIQSCSGELERSICEFLSSCILDKDASGNELKKSYHEITIKVFQCAPQILNAVIPNLTQELLVCHSVLSFELEASSLVIKVLFIFPLVISSCLLGQFLT